MNIIKRELKAHLKGMIIWCSVMILLIIVWMSEFSAYYDNPEMAEVLKSIPEAMLKAFSMHNANLTTVEGFISLVMVFVYIIAGIHAVLLGSSIISKEERDKTAEFLFTLPVPRHKVILSKLAAALINCIILNAVINLTQYLGTLKYESGPDFGKFMWLIILGTFIIQLIFLSLGMLMAAILRRYKKSGSVSLFILLGTYFLSVMLSFSDKIEFLKYTTPFKFFEPNSLLNDLKFEAVYIIISAVIITAGITGTFIFYQKRDLHI